MGALGKLGPRPARMSAMLRRDSAQRALREAEERPTAQILRRRKISKIELGRIWICFVATRAKQARPAEGRRLLARLLARRATTGALRGRRGRSAGRREAVAGRALSCVVRNCEYDARRCARRASRGRTGCPWSCSRPWRRSRVTRAAVVEGAGAGVARLWSWVGVIVSGFGLLSGFGGWSAIAK